MIQSASFSSLSTRFLWAAVTLAAQVDLTVLIIVVAFRRVLAAKLYPTFAISPTKHTRRIGTEVEQTNSTRSAKRRFTWPQLKQKQQQDTKAADEKRRLNGRKSCLPSHCFNRNAVNASHRLAALTCCRRSKAF